MSPRGPQSPRTLAARADLGYGPLSTLHTALVISRTGRLYLRRKMFYPKAILGFGSKNEQTNKQQQQNPNMHLCFSESSVPEKQAPFYKYLSISVCIVLWVKAVTIREWSGHFASLRGDVAAAPGTGACEGLEGPGAGQGPVLTPGLARLWPRVASEAETPGHLLVPAARTGAALKQSRPCGGDDWSQLVALPRRPSGAPGQLVAGRWW